MGTVLGRIVAPLLPASLTTRLSPVCTVFNQAQSTPLTKPRPLPTPPKHYPPSSSIHTAEAVLLSHLTTTPYTKRPIYLPRTGHTLNTLSAGSSTAPVLVLLHGWGAGAAFFGLNLAGLSRHFRVHVVDWLGFGGSSRPAHRLAWDADEAERFFIDPLAEWMQVMRELEPFEGGVHLVGHSMGAFLAVAFALRYPQMVRNLVLASPVGVPKAPVDKLGRMRGGWRRKLLFRVVFGLWEWGWTPQVLVRWGGGNLGRRLAGRMILARFGMNDSKGEEALVEYFYQISAAPASGEYSLSTVLESGAYARRPLCERLVGVTVPVAFLYGDRDWMSADAGTEVTKRMRVKSWVKKIAGAGHHVYFDNAAEFNQLVLQACTEVADGRIADG
eukprot:GFKZ01008355.1.p1 GENE.GFKZ01008355.1~~GFKZ01008355.1.p1  ORF type:complete len:420 (+),score=36.30 GFKZ01008355.1:105-1262(+)